MKISINTKKLLWALAAALLGAMTAQAVPAHPKAVDVMQSDGSKLTIKLVGDEFYHRTMTTDGYTLMQRANGDYVYAVQSGSKLVPGNVIAHNPQERTAAELGMMATLQHGLHNQSLLTQGRNARSSRDKKVSSLKTSVDKSLKEGNSDWRGLVILINYKNKKFSYASTMFDDMFNKDYYTGYTSKNGNFVSCTGSARDYFRDNSMGQFLPHFDVVGPVDVNYNSTYPQGYNNCGNIFVSAVDAVNSYVDFSDYDLDGDGVVDIIYFIVAGYTSNFGGNNSGYLWPHQYDMRAYTYNTYDGVQLGSYSCSGEIYGWEGYGYVDPDGIGTVVHEFSHALGLMDLYDTDYEDNGTANDPGEWDVMSGASYLDDSHTPAGFTIWERYRLGFTDKLTLIEQKTQGYVLEPVNTSNAGFMIATQNDNEFFVIDNRQQTGWDAYIPGHGMMIARVEYDEEQWWYNTINCDASHMYYELLRAGNGNGSSGSDPYPGTRRVTAVNNTTSPSLKTWSGAGNDMGIAGITETNGVITFNVVNGDGSDPAPAQFITVDPATLSMNTLVGQPVTKTFTVTGTNLTGNLTLSLSGGNGAFSVSPTTITANQAASGKTVTVTYNPQAFGTNSATITISGGGAQAVTVTLNGQADLVKYAPVMLPADEDYISLTGFRADWTDQSPAASVASYTLEINKKGYTKPDEPTHEVKEIASADFSGTTSVSGSSGLPNVVDNYADYLPTDWTATSGLWAYDGYIISGDDCSISTPTLDLTGYDVVTVEFTAMSYYPSYYGAASLEIATSLESTGGSLGTSESWGTYYCVLNCAQNDKVTITGTGSYYGLQSVKVYAGDNTGNYSMMLTAPRLMVNDPGGEDYRLITEITPDKFYNVANLTAGGTYEYRVKTVYADGTESEWSNTEEVTLLEPGHGYEIGDVNHDGAIDPADISALIDYLLNGSQACEICADVNGDGAIDPADISALIDYLLNGPRASIKAKKSIPMFLMCR